MNSVAIITGASGGLGVALTKALLASGWIVVAGVRNPSKAIALKSMQKRFNYKLKIIKADVTHLNQLQHLNIAAIKLGKLSLVINNAGTANGKALETISPKDFLETFQVNVFAPLRLTQITLPQLRKNNGTVINISSVVGSITIPYLGAYSASKHSLNSLTIALHLELLNSRVKFMLVQPGPLASRLCGDAIAPAKKEVYKESQEAVAKEVKKVGQKHGVPTDKAAELILRRLNKNKQFQIVIIGLWTKIIMRLAQFLPVVYFQRLLAWYYKIQLKN